MRITDGTVLRLITGWLTAPILEQNEHGRKTARRSDKGTPQGGVISPWLSNIYLPGTAGWNAGGVPGECGSTESAVPHHSAPGGSNTCSTDTMVRPSGRMPA